MQDEILTAEVKAVLRKFASNGGRKKTPRKAAASRKNGRLGGWWKQKRNLVRVMDAETTQPM
jgi:hypothetical protein